MVLGMRSVTQHPGRLGRTDVFERDVHNSRCLSANICICRFEWIMDRYAKHMT
jgi:hypothetical protein